MSNEMKSLIKDILLKVSLPPELKAESERLLKEESNTSFMENYNALRGTVAILKEMDEPDVDAIIPLVEQGMAAYRGCEDRIKKVENYLTDFEAG